MKVASLKFKGVLHEQIAFYASLVLPLTLACFAECSTPFQLILAHSQSLPLQEGMRLFYFSYKKQALTKQFPLGHLGVSEITDTNFTKVSTSIPGEKRQEGEEAEDSIFRGNGRNGTISHLNPTASPTVPTGKYIVVLEHTNLTPALYSLYAHLRLN